jgi:hypothetical protein
METDIGEFTQQNQQPLEQDDYLGQGGGYMGPTASQFQYFPQQPQVISQPSAKVDIFAELGKTAYIIIFVAFILGFFMGKTMQPVILRPN